MSDEFRILTPHGIAIYPNQTNMSGMPANPTLTQKAVDDANGDVLAAAAALTRSGLNGTKIAHGYNYVPISKQLVTAYRLGTWNATHIGTRGTVEIEVITGAAGSARALVHLTDGSGDEDLAVTLDDQNRPQLSIVTAGSAVVTWSEAGPAIAEGVPLKLRVVWDSENEISPGLYATFLYLNGSAPAGSWSDSGASWSAKPYTSISIGHHPSVADFNGTVGVVQVGE